MTSHDLAIEALDLRKRYGSTTAVAGISLDVHRGEVFGILGTNGAGKTTTVEMIAGLRRPDAGQVRVLGLDPAVDRGKVRQVLGVQLQSSALHGSLTVTELVDLYASLYPRPVPTGELIDQVGLTEQAGTRFEKLSGGQQQRLSIALALVGRPRVVILDELTTGLDPRARREMWRTVENLRAGGVTVLLVSHAMEEVEALCDRVALFVAGQVAALDTPQGMTERAGVSSLDEAFVALTGQEPEEVR